MLKNKNDISTRIWNGAYFAKLQNVQMGIILQVSFGKNWKFIAVRLYVVQEKTFSLFLLPVGIDTVQISK